jgi:hypothetical protein
LRKEPSTVGDLPDGKINRQWGPDTYRAAQRTATGRDAVHVFLRKTVQQVGVTDMAFC